MIVITGAAGFIGYHLTRKLADSGYGKEIRAIDSFNSYYDPGLKAGRAALLEKDYGILVKKVDITDSEALGHVIDASSETVIHLAAQAGVRYSIEHPQEYIDANIVGFSNILECVRTAGTKHLVYASSSSVYGNESPVPFSESNPLTTQESLYAVTKATNEMMARVYSQLYGIAATGLRFFTVYGSWGRPDMAYYSFADAIKESRPIQVYNNGDMERDFTHVSDIVEGIKRILEKGPANRETGLSAVYNIGRGKPVRLLDFITTLETLMGKNVEKIMVPMQPGDVRTTWADVSALERDYQYKPEMDLSNGLAEFVGWYEEYAGA